MKSDQEDDAPLCVLNTVLWVPTEYVEEENKDDYTYSFEEVEYLPQVGLPQQCSSCDLWGKKWRKGRRTCNQVGYELDSLCKSFTPKKEPKVTIIPVKTYAKQGDWTKFSRGDMGKIERNFGHLGIEDQRSCPELDFDLKCTRELYPEQKKVVNEWLDHKYGILQAPTSWGKTVAWSWLVAHLHTRVLLLAQEVRHLMVGFEGLYEHTNIAEIEEEAGEHLIGVLNKDWEWDTDSDGVRYRKWKQKKGKYYPITFATFQAFNSKLGEKQLKQLRNYFGMVCLEEAHHGAAKTFHKVTRSFNPRYRYGQTATPTRKDKMHVALYDAIGPVVARGTKEQLLPEVHYHHTNVLVPDRCFIGKYAMPQIVNYLASNSVYQEALYEKVIEECEEGRKILIITERKNHAHRLKQKIELQGFKVELMMGNMKLKEQNWYAEQLLSGDLNVIIGTQVINENVNIPPMDSIHQPFPNFGKEREEQRVGRIRRPLSGSNIKFLEENDIEWRKSTPRVHLYTWHSSNDLAAKALNFRASLYKKWGFHFASSNEVRSEGPKVKTMKEWLAQSDEGPGGI